MKKYKYNKQADVGEKGLKKVLEMIKNKEGVEKILNVRDSVNYKRVGVDIIIIKKDCQYSAEVRTDTLNNDLIYLELVSNLKTFSVGCFLRTISNFLFYYKTSKDRVYIINTAKLKSLIFEKIHEGDSEIILKFGGCNKMESGELFVGLGILVSIEWIKKYIKIDEYNLPFEKVITDSLPF